MGVAHAGVGRPRRPRCEGIGAAQVAPAAHRYHFELSDESLVGATVCRFVPAAAFAGAQADGHVGRNCADRFNLHAEVIYVLVLSPAHEVDHHLPSARGCYSGCSHSFGQNYFVDFDLHIPARTRVDFVFLQPHLQSSFGLRAGVEGQRGARAELNRHDFHAAFLYAQYELLEVSAESFADLGIEQVDRLGIGAEIVDAAVLVFAPRYYPVGLAVGAGENCFVAQTLSKPTRRARVDGRYRQPERYVVLLAALEQRVDQRPFVFAVLGFHVDPIEQVSIFR